MANLENEVWADIFGYEGLYMVSTFGRVKSLSRMVRRTETSLRRHPERILRPSIVSGYPRVELFKESVGKCIHVHRLVAEAFCKGGGDVVRHIDGNPLNAKSDNLEFGSYRDNEADKRRHGRVPEGVMHARAVLNDEKVLEIRRLRKNGLSHRKIASEVGVKHGVVWWVISGKTWGHVDG